MFTGFNMSAVNKKNQSIEKQIIKNINIGWEVNQTSNYRWSDFHIGTAYGQRFEFDRKASWQLGLNYNWNKYTLYSSGNLTDGTYNSILKNQSFTIPLIASYQLRNSFFTGLSVYTGSLTELILFSTLDRDPFVDYNALQIGWTVGVRIRVLAIFNAKLGYVFYPTPLFSDGSFNRSAVSFSLGF
jgi:hypothetical protein